jgi:hypothetical protein
VWGKPVSEDIQAEKEEEPRFGDKSEYPQVVCDAMTVIRILEPSGSKFLWVDQHCISREKIPTRISKFGQWTEFMKEHLPQS